VKAYVLTIPTDTRYSEADCHSSYQLPRVSCKVCGESWVGDTEVWYPTLTLKPTAPKSKYSDTVEVSPEEFRSLKKMLAGPTKDLRLVAGARIGPLIAKLPGRGTDFLWCGFKLLAKNSVIKKLEEANFTITYEAIVDRKPASINNYMAIQLDPVPMYSAKTLNEMTLHHCSECGSCEMTDFRAKPKGPREYILSRIPENAPFVRIYESPGTLATPRFEEFLKKEKVTGIELEETGVFI
jgi:hypothetical protein